MTKRIKHGSQLIHQSLRVVRNQKKLIILPLFSSILIILLLSFIITPIIDYEKAQIVLHKSQIYFIVSAYIITALCLFLIHQITIHFNAALIYCVNEYFTGQPISLKKGIKAANKHFIQLYNWNSYSGTIGILIHLSQYFLHGTNFYKKLLQNLAWRIATYLVIPIIMTHQLGPVKSIKLSAQLIQRTWGTELKTNFGFIPLLLLARFITLIPAIIGLIQGTHQSLLIGISASIILIIVVSTISSASITILARVLYNYATEEKVAPEFNEELIKKAFIKQDQ